MTDEKKTDGSFLFKQDGPVATISINKPPMNPMSLEFFDELEALVPKMAEYPSVRAIVFTADEKENFSVGMGLKRLAA